MKRRAYDIVEGGRFGHPQGRVFDGVIIALVLLSVAASVLETDARARAGRVELFVAIDVLCGALFTLEYLLRAWVSTEDRRNRYRDPLLGRLRYLLTPPALIDLVAILPSWLALLSPMAVGDLWLFRVFRILKLLRFSSAIEIFAAVLRNERRPLTSALTIMVMLVVLLSSLMYLIERDTQPDRFGSVPEAMWWGVVTLATVGYGDVVPVTPLGRLVGSATVVIGMGMFALPAGIIASGFVEETRRRNFVVTWNLVASVPFFQNLPAARIAEIADVLEAQVAARGETIILEGDRADCMYFIVEGEVEVQVSPPVRLHAGDFFGEIALLTESPRSASVIASTTCQLLVLRVSEFSRLMIAHDDLRDEIARVAEKRLAGPVAAGLQRN